MSAKKKAAGQAPAPFDSEAVARELWAKTSGVIADKALLAGVTEKEMAGLALYYLSFVLGGVASLVGGAAATRAVTELAELVEGIEGILRVRKGAP